MSKDILIFTLGPVQSFIEEARRAGDLWAGSRLLVELIRAGAEAAQGEPIFPRSLMATSLPNKFVVVVDGDGRAAAERAEKAVRRRLGEVGERVIVEFDDRDKTFNRIWREQLEQHLEVYWATAPCATEDDYLGAYERASGLLEARKRTRDFSQVEEGGAKDSLSGQRAALHTGTKDGQHYWSDFAGGANRRSTIKLGERLDALGAIKRFGRRWAGEESSRFPSVSSVAARPYFSTARGMKELVALSEALRRHGIYEVNHFGPEFPFDGDLLYAETYSSRRLNASYGTGEAKEARRALDSLYRKMKDLHLRQRPCPYYAVLYLDGDRMGEHIGTCRSRADHEAIGGRLGRFTEVVEGIMNRYSGFPVYSGGDDLLTLLPLEEALPAAKELADTYADVMRPVMQRKEGLDFPFTCSGGLALAHHLYPLGAALEEARGAVGNAKEVYGRDAICVRILKRSGERSEVGGKWHVGERGVDTVETVREVVGDLEGERLAAGFIYEVDAEVAALGRVDGPMRLSLLRRVLKRHSPKGAAPRTTAEGLSAWADAFDAGDAEKGQRDGMGELKEWLLLASFMARGGDE
ncbi:MAG: type III-B CRISPR-associated protein Cas10/Cmr2 [Chloroflexi bacterium]|nr:type III-B CRISPR-associated protein Cas10/Cmr2 [Chloroflexota bacterium]